MEIVYIICFLVGAVAVGLALNFVISVPRDLQRIAAAMERISPPKEEPPTEEASEYQA